MGAIFKNGCKVRFIFELGVRTNQSIAVRRAQIRRCSLLGSDDSPETLDEGLWQLDIYDPSSCHTASIFTPVTPWPESKSANPSARGRSERRFR
jgi:hypothetical protein